jgi:hypothetical protein
MSTPFKFDTANTPADILQALSTFNREAPGHADRSGWIIRRTKYWVYHEATGRFGPNKFVAYPEMTFAAYERAHKLRDRAPWFNGKLARLAIVSVIDKKYVPEPALHGTLIEWAESLLGRGALGDRAEWMFIRLDAAASSSDGPTPADEYRDTPSPTTGQDSPAPRRAAIIERIVRDTAVTAEVKQLHGHRCQVCGMRLETRTGPYAEGGHVRPLGSPHDGPDVLPNVLCLCPNHHVLLDGGAFSIRDDMTLLGIDGRLRVVAGHRLHPAHLKYHRQMFAYEA